MRLSDIEPRFICGACGARGADVRPDFNWNRTATDDGISQCLCRPLNSIIGGRHRQISPADNKCVDRRGGFPGWHNRDATPLGERRDQRMESAYTDLTGQFVTSGRMTRLPCAKSGAWMDLRGRSQDSASVRRQHGVGLVAVALEDDNGAIAYRKSATQQLWNLVGERRGQGDRPSGHSVTDSDGW